MVQGLEGAMQVSKLCIPTGIGCGHVSAIRLEHRIDGDENWHLIKAQLTRAHQSPQGDTPQLRGSWVCDTFDASLHDIGMDCAPQVTHRSAAEDAQR
jgi:hypothetical protein